MPRTADYTILGFLYQFNKTALEILTADDDKVITVEGIVEDIEISSPFSLTAIQCKYHEASKEFTASAIYKPLLQMFKHYYENPSANIHYVLFAHFPNTKHQNPSIDQKSLNAALSSTDQDLQKFIIKNPEKDKVENFFSRFNFEFGPSYDELVSQVGKKLEENGIPHAEIEVLAYPNTIHMIATFSTKHNVDDRKTTKNYLLTKIKEIRTTIISQWTLSLKSRKKILDARRKQLKTHLDKNSHLRYIIVDPNSIEDYESQIILFISDFLTKFHFKPAHIHTPILCLCTNREKLLDIQRRLYLKNIIAEDGYIGGTFQKNHFFREPICSKSKSGNFQREFALRILSWDDHKEILNDRKCDDLIIIGKTQCDSLDTSDVNVERFEGATVKEVKYIMGVSDVYE